MLFRSLVVLLGGLLLWKQICSLLTDKLLQLPLPDKGFDLLFQVIAVNRVIIVITVETTVSVSRPFVGIPLQLSGEGLGSFVLDLH